MSAPLQTSIECVLFDLDGTLIDTAPDFVIVVNRLLAETQSAPIAADLIRRTVSDGARALVKLALAIDEADPQFANHLERLLGLYYEQLETTQSVLYPGLEELLGKFAAQNIKWGIVTNKPALYAERLLQQLGLRESCQSLVCPDHVHERKPHPEPILLACRQLGCNTERTVYIGDHIRDIQAAKNADVIAIAAAYGYLAADTKVDEWYADFILNSSTQTESLLNLLKFA